MLRHATMKVAPLLPRGTTSRNIVSLISPNSSSSLLSAPSSYLSPTSVVLLSFHVLFHRFSHLRLFFLRSPLPRLATNARSFFYAISLSRHYHYNIFVTLAFCFSVGPVFRLSLTLKASKKRKFSLFRFLGDGTAVFPVIIYSSLPF